jgi:hypothetical protein
LPGRASAELTVQMYASRKKMIIRGSSLKILFFIIDFARLVILQ